MNTAYPAAGAALPFFQLLYRARYMLPPRILLFHERNPADPLIARKRRETLPQGECLSVGEQRFAEVYRNRMCGPPLKSRITHRLILANEAFTACVLLQNEDSWETHGFPIPSSTGNSRFPTPSRPSPAAKSLRVYCCGTWTRTKILCSRGRCPTIRRSRNSYCVARPV
jgi:hypothetical protein